MTFHLRLLSPLRASSTKEEWLTNAYTSSSLVKYEPVLIAALGHNRAGMKIDTKKNDASKVTLPAWPGQGYGRYWLSSGLLVQICILSVVGRI